LDNFYHLTLEDSAMNVPALNLLVWMCGYHSFTERLDCAHVAQFAQSFFFHIAAARLPLATFREQAYPRRYLSLLAWRVAS